MNTLSYEEIDEIEEQRRQSLTELNKDDKDWYDRFKPGTRGST